ncbi:MAG: nodulation protein NfeD [Candidatus Celaenobacter antarcticus]|nr:nodulation protein NfeD [Candidatus Celaenobacter antarcticus]
MKKIIIVIFILFLPFIIHAQTTIDEIYLLTVDGTIGPPIANYIIDRIETAEAHDAAVLIEIDTPGGLDTSMREIIQKIMNADVPVIGYVTPEGARAASAGAIIMLACDISAMTPTSSIGAAHPVSMGAKIDSTMEKKVVNDMLSYVASIAQKTGRNEDIAKKMVSESISLPAREALDKNIITYLASSRKDLFKQIDSSEIIKNDKVFIMSTEHVNVIPSRMNFIERFLFYITNPNIAYILLMLGIYGLIAEFSSPGIGFAGVFGAISLLLAFFALSNLPVNIVGLLLIIVGFILLFLELKVQSSGILGIGGVVGIVLGSMMLIQSKVPFLRISLSLIIGVAIFTILFFLLLVTLVLKVHKSRVTTGREGEIGERGLTKTVLNPEGQVFVRGELWTAISTEGKIEENQPIEVVKIKDLTLWVKRVSSQYENS